jgi:hypothetical protein
VVERLGSVEVGDLTPATIRSLQDSLERERGEFGARQPLKTLAAALRWAGQRHLAVDVRITEPPRRHPSRTERLRVLAGERFTNVTWELCGARGRGYYATAPQIYCHPTECPEFCAQAFWGGRIWLGRNFDEARAQIAAERQRHHRLTGAPADLDGPLESHFARRGLYFHAGSDPPTHSRLGFYAKSATTPLPACPCVWCRHVRQGRSLYLGYNSYDAGWAAARFELYHAWLMSSASWLPVELQLLAYELARQLADAIARPEPPPVALPERGERAADALRALAGEDFSSLFYDRHAGGWSWTAIPRPREGCYCYNCQAGHAGRAVLLGPNAALAAEAIERHRADHRHGRPGLRLCGPLADIAPGLGFAELLSHRLCPAEAASVELTGRSLGLLVIVVELDAGAVSIEAPLRFVFSPSSDWRELSVSVVSSATGVGCAPLRDPLALGQLFGAGVDTPINAPRNRQAVWSGFGNLAVWSGFGNLSALASQTVTLVNHAGVPGRASIWWRALARVA